jgi:DNA-binding NarL/FixJ family response regulator
MAGDTLYIAPPGCTRPRLSTREEEVMRCIAEGMRNP